MTATNITFNSASAPQATGPAIRDIKPPVEIPSGWAAVGWVLAGLALAGLLCWAWKYWQKRRSMVPPEPVIPPHVRARRKLEEALALIGQPREFCILVSDTIRGYLEERFNFHAPERTTEEFLYELRETNLLTPEQKESLGHFLQQCDLVKFARYEPGEPELRDLHHAALRLVEETEPVEPQPGARSASGDADNLPGATDKNAAAELQAANRVLP
jgi:hypothetical protein